MSPDDPTHVHSVLRTTDASAPQLKSHSITVGHLNIDLSERRVFRAGEGISLSPLEFKLLEILAVYRGRLLPFRFLIEDVWGPDQFADRGDLRYLIAELRRKLEPDPIHPRYLFTEIDVGYRFADE